MKMACVRAIAELALAEASDVVATAYGDQELKFGPDYILPKPFDPRLIVHVAPAVAKAAMASGVATRPIADLDAYREELSRFVFRTGYVMKGIFARAKSEPKRVVYAEGEAPRVLHAVQTALDEGFVRPILIGRRRVVAGRLGKLGLRMRLDAEVELCDPEDDPRYKEYWTGYHAIMERRGVSPAKARAVIRAEPTVIAAMMVRRGEADAMVAGPASGYGDHLRHLVNVIGLAPGVREPSAMQMLLLDKGTFFMADTNVAYDPDAEEVADLAVRAAEVVRRFGIEPKVALLSHSNFGSAPSASSAKMQEALELIRQRTPNLEVEGEMHGDTALSEAIRQEIFPNSRLKGAANLLIMPGLDAASIAFNLVKQLANGLSVGPLLMGLALPAFIATQSVSVRGIVNLSAFAVVDAQTRRTFDGDQAPRAAGPVPSAAAARAGLA
jgi:malate dehydrogenase (oxaloacetate-decarboxylating)(NADP+)